MKKSSTLITWIIAMILIVLMATFVSKTLDTGVTIPYNDFQQKWIEDKVKSIEVKEDKLQIHGVLNDNTSFVTYAPIDTLNILMKENPKSNVRVEFNPPSSAGVWLQIIPLVLILVMCIVTFFMFTQQAQGGGGNRGVMNFGKSRARMASPDSKRVTFNDVAGADEEKAELVELVDFLKEPKKYIVMGARIPKGVLLVGPPGTGKTLLAKAIAGEAGVPFFTISGSDFVEMFVGVGASRVRDLFEQAKKNSPCIVFIDEIDAVGRQRGAGFGGGHDEREQTLNQLLVEMDGFGVNEGIIMIAATNRPDVLDPALLRPGRFDRQIVVGAPDVKGREEILKVHTKNKPLAEDINLKTIAKITPGFTGADLENLANESALLAVKRGLNQITMHEMEDAITRVAVGTEKKSRVISEKDKKLTAYHEAGHAVIMKVLPNTDPVHEISIIPRGMAGGYTMPLPTEDKSYTSKSDLLDEMTSLLGGRVAEKLVIGDISTGAKNDIDRASNIARKMVMEYGMSEEIGTISFDTGNDEVFLGRDLGKSRNFSEEVSAKIDNEVKKLIDNAYREAEEVLKSNMNKLRAVAEALIEKEKLQANEFEEIFNNA
ncbi:MAG: ATP-dependent zinc metalloprotease FtsH [Inconstantimicrobium porci]|uniref:ATP-dependent zinc metalloprotease FtsH n=1 Tax=Inconstantimicrobium porci TaxID=2652291 RepID=UPI00240984F0|nr:ATP-dependent zinc metalloprotease FtsH [Inconstantimicrobium porci]MDD6769832.1 ATP-dependent zinc metalloprotease FtsH [Inconstantimicrobium porci]MDY5912381.1 ATP-dependent zinc metalloprotease FtsH [Inconstantimicrobium porci]